MLVVDGFCVEINVIFGGNDTCEMYVRGIVDCKQGKKKSVIKEWQEKK